MRVLFPGTRGYIELSSSEHRRHSCLLVSHRGRTILIDCGEDWLRHRAELDDPEAVLVTHAHPDHAGGLRNGWDVPVWASEAAWQRMKRFPLIERHLLASRVPYELAGMDLEAFPLVHSLLAPAVALRVRAGRRTIFYAPDVLAIPERSAALRGVDLYVGDGAVLRRDLARQREGGPIGHASIATQLGWCAEAAVGRAVFTHCGSAVVRNPAGAAATLAELAAARHVKASFAYDGLELVL